MEFGISMPIVQQVPARAQPWEAGAGAAELLAVARAADRLGFSHLSVCDHVAIPRADAPAAGTVWYDAATTLAFLAAATTRIRLLSHVVVLPYRHPLVIAKAFATLDHLSDGRVILGVGSGHLRGEFQSLGVSYAERGATTDESLQAVRAAWEQVPATFTGRFVQFREVIVAPRPRQQPRPPIWVGGNSAAAARRAALYADGWIPWLITPDEFARQLRRAHRLRPPAGRHGRFECVAPLAVAGGDTDTVIRARVEEWQAAGATAVHVAFAHSSLDHLLDRMARFARLYQLPAAPE